jgi:hypothetical protein
MLDMRVLCLLFIGTAIVVHEYKHWRIHPLYPDMGQVILRRHALREAWRKALRSLTQKD